MQRFRIRVAKLELDMLAMALDSFAADTKFFRDLTAAMSSRDQRKYRHLTIAEDTEAVRNFAITGKFVHGNRSDRSTGVDLARQHGLNRVH